MEETYQNGDDVNQLEIIEQTNDNNITMTKKKKKSSSRGMHMFSVVMFMLRRRNHRRRRNNTGFWRRIIDSVRKSRPDITIMPSSNTNVLPLPTTETTPPATESPPPPVTESGRDRDVDEVFTAASCSSSSGISGYGSAMSLRDLDYHGYDDNDDDDDDEGCYSDVEGGDDMIDEKAEEFIVRFYEQMKMQNRVYNERCKAKGIMMDIVE